MILKQVKYRYVKFGNFTVKIPTPIDGYSLWVDRVYNSLNAFAKCKSTTFAKI